MNNPDGLKQKKGFIFQINISNGGVPKKSIPTAQILKTGLASDRQTHTKIHGGPDQAVCLYSLECIMALQIEGHPIYPGSTGENLTIFGINWEDIQPGVKLDIGDVALLEITKYTTPCSAITGSFIDGEIKRISQKHHPGWSRVYAKVLKTGDIFSADRIKIIE